ncbi:hypothetical protein Hamer_G021891 [Homarus americanus]|uniref:Uncharacterized protein n=1 Tax=Homarus americanus TaxID=6706 RepID=A0A8J5NDU1_HOMAM|nr:hypothetical protein Hamer_G021891 [Homarus americanus]
MERESQPSMNSGTATTSNTPYKISTSHGRRSQSCMNSFTDVVAVHHDITSISKEVSFEENVAEVLENFFEELSTEDLLLQ